MIAKLDFLFRFTPEALDRIVAALQAQEKRDRENGQLDEAEKNRELIEWLTQQ